MRKLKPLNKRDAQIAQMLMDEIKQEMKMPTETWEEFERLFLEENPALVEEAKTDRKNYLKKMKFAASSKVISFDDVIEFLECQDISPKVYRHVLAWAAQEVSDILHKHYPQMNPDYKPKVEPYDPFRIGEPD
jgi:hypothetical protein